MDLKQKFSNYAANYAVDCTTTIAVCTPIFAGLETMVADMSNDVSWTARKYGAGLVIFGGGKAFTLGRDYLLKRRETKQKNGKKNGSIYAQDTNYTLLFNLVTSPLFYFISGCRDAREIAVGTGMAMLMAVAGGGPFGYTLDLGRDLAGVKSSERVHSWIKNRSPLTKKSIAALGLGVSAGLTALIYGLNK